jgi:hypothetical protein
MNSVNTFVNFGFYLGIGIGLKNLDKVWLHLGIFTEKLFRFLLNLSLNLSSARTLQVINRFLQLFQRISQIILKITFIRKNTKS